MKDSNFALAQMKYATKIGEEWADGKTSATLEDVMTVAWALTSAVFFTGYQIAKSHEEKNPDAV